MLAALCAIVSALLYALASVLQQRGAAEQPAEQSLRIGLLTRLLRNPTWLLGLLCDIGAYVFQFLALGHGPMVVVQPILVCGLLFALPLGAAWSGRRLRGGDWLAALLVCAGLALFLVLAQPARGVTDVSGRVWAMLLVATGGPSAVLVLASLKRPPWLRAALLSAASGVIYGAAAALTVTTAHLLGNSVTSVLESWQPYALAIAGIGGMLVSQSSFQAGSLGVSLPLMSVVDPVVSILIGALAFRESIADDPLPIMFETVGLILMAAGVVLLARSEAIRSLHETNLDG